MKKLSIKDSLALLQSRDNILLLTHRNPDGDTLGSAAALCSALRRLGKICAIYDNPETTDRFPEFIGKYIYAGDFQPEFVISVDVASENMFPAGFSGKVDMAIDHHPSNTFFAPLTAIRAKASACAELIIDLIKRLPGEMTAEEATLLYIALSTDTGCFQYSNTNGDTFAAASYLMSMGADNLKINDIFFRKVSPARIRLEGMIYSNMRLYRSGTVCVAPVTLDMIRESGASEEDMEDLAGLAGRMAGASLAVTIREKGPSECRISLRSDSSVDSSRICSYFGGGGHFKAAGCTIYDCPEKAEKILLDVINEVMQ